MLQPSIVKEVEGMIGSATDISREAQDLQMFQSGKPENWLLNKAIRGSASMINILINASEKYLRLCFHETMQRYRALSWQQGDQYVADTMERLYKTITKGQRIATTLKVLPQTSEQSRAVLDAFLQDAKVEEFKQTLEAEAQILAHREHWQVSGDPDVIKSLVKTVAHGLQPTWTSGENLLCGPRALVKSPNGMKTLPREATAEMILAEMYTDFRDNTLCQITPGAN